MLCWDLTDSFHRDPRGHAWGTDQIIANIERRWCPTVTSDQLVGGTAVPFRGGSAVEPYRAVGLTSRCTVREWYVVQFNGWRVRIGASIIAHGESALVGEL